MSAFVTSSRMPPSIQLDVVIVRLAYVPSSETMTGMLVLLIGNMNSMLNMSERMVSRVTI